MAWPLGQVAARAPAGSMEPGTLARAALALGATDTGRVAPPRPLAELEGAGTTPETEARPLGMPLLRAALLEAALLGAALAGAALAGAALAGAALAGAALLEAALAGAALAGAALLGAVLTGAEADARAVGAAAGAAGLLASAPGDGAHSAPGAGGGGSSYP
ncbi:hypothetical protein [Actinoplanes nipponensis]|nr:hypothetical protein [Actinoplanes nipponensis]